MTKSTPQQPADLVGEVIQSLKQMAQAGCRGFDCSPEYLEILNQWKKPLAFNGKTPAPGQRLPGKETLADIRTDLGDCRRCKLCEGRNSIVFGQGAEKTRLVFVGEGPGAD